MQGLYIAKMMRDLLYTYMEEAFKTSVLKDSNEANVLGNLANKIDRDINERQVWEGQAANGRDVQNNTVGITIKSKYRRIGNPDDPDMLVSNIPRQIIDDRVSRLRGQSLSITPKTSNPEFIGWGEWSKQKIEYLFFDNDNMRAIDGVIRDKYYTGMGYMLVYWDSSDKDPAYPNGRPKLKQVLPEYVYIDYSSKDENLGDLRRVTWIEAVDIDDLKDIVPIADKEKISTGGFPAGCYINNDGTDKNLGLVCVYNAQIKWRKRVKGRYFSRVNIMQNRTAINYLKAEESYFVPEKSIKDAIEELDITMPDGKTIAGKDYLRNKMDMGGLLSGYGDVPMSPEGWEWSDPVEEDIELVYYLRWSNNVLLEGPHCLGKDFHILPLGYKHTTLSSSCFGMIYFVYKFLELEAQLWELTKTNIGLAALPIKTVDPSAFMGTPEEISENLSNPGASLCLRPEYTSLPHDRDAINMIVLQDKSAEMINVINIVQQIQQQLFSTSSVMQGKADYSGQSGTAIGYLQMLGSSALTEDVQQYNKLCTRIVNIFKELLLYYDVSQSDTRSMLDLNGNQKMVRILPSAYESNPLSQYALNEEDILNGDPIIADSNITLTVAIDNVADIDKKQKTDTAAMLNSLYPNLYETLRSFGKDPEKYIREMGETRQLLIALQSLMPQNSINQGSPDLNPTGDTQTLPAETPADSVNNMQLQMQKK